MASDSYVKRILDLAFEDGAPRAPLAGLFPSGLPVPTLDEALVGVASSLSHLHPTSGRSVKIARKQTKRVQPKFPNLSADECTAIVLYTMEEIPREDSLYYAMNAALRAKHRGEVRPWRDYIWLLLHALKKLPPVSKSVVFRGCRQSPADLNLELTDGFDFTWSSFSSTATTQGVMETFVGTSGSRTLLTLELTEPIARSVTDFSLFPSENEVLLPPNVCFETVSHFDAGHGLIMLQCRQSETIDPILDLAPVLEPAPSVLPQPPLAPVASEADQLAWALKESRILAEKAAADKAVAETVAAENPTVPTVSSAEIDAFMKKVGSSMDAVKAATSVGWLGRSLTDSDCKVIAHLGAIGALAQLEELYLFNKQIGDAGITVLADACGRGAMALLEVSSHPSPLL